MKNVYVYLLRSRPKATSRLDSPPRCSIHRRNTLKAGEEGFASECVVSIALSLIAWVEGSRCLVRPQQQGMRVVYASYINEQVNRLREKFQRETRPRFPGKLGFSTKRTWLIFRNSITQLHAVYVMRYPGTRHTELFHFHTKNGVEIKGVLGSATVVVSPPCKEAKRN